MPQGKPSGPRRELPPAVDIDAQYGPAMLALPSDRHRRFVEMLYEVPPGFGFGVAAARAAGWGCEGSSAGSMATIASRLLHDERILQAVHEMDRARIRASAPRAIRSLAQLIEDPEARDHIKAVSLVLDRVHPAQTTHVVSVEHRASASMQATTQVMARILELAERAQVPPMIDAPMIDVTPEKPA